MTPSSFAHDFNQRLTTISTLALIAHKSPDGDALGSLAGLQHLIKDNYPHITISIVVPPEPFVDTHVNWILGDISETLPAADLTIVLDTALWSRTALADTTPPLSILSIDHHEKQPENIPGYTDSTAPSTTIILAEIAQELHWQVSSDAATALLLGVYTDTGGFMHSNSNQRAFETASFLIEKGADQQRITQEVFGNYTLEYLHDLGSGLLSIVQVGTIACLFFTETPNNAHLKSHIITYLSGLTGVDVACVLMQKGDEVKGSFRTRKSDIDVNELAKKFGGGGHKKAAGFTLVGSMKDSSLSWLGKEYSAEDFAAYLQDLIN